MSTDTIIALRSVHDHPKFHNLKAHEVEMPKLLMDSCRQARKRYFEDQRSRALSAEKFEKEEAKKNVNEEIDNVNTEIRQTISLMENLKQSADDIGFRAEKRTALGKSLSIIIYFKFFCPENTIRNAFSLILKLPCVSVVHFIVVL